MKRKISYTDEPIALGATVKDFLPPPGELALQDKSVRVTLNLNEGVSTLCQSTRLIIFGLIV